MKTKTFPQPPAPPPVVVDDSTNALQITFFVDQVNGPSVLVHFVDTNGQQQYAASYPLSSYSTVTGAQKTALRSVLQAIRDETFTKEGFV